MQAVSLRSEAAHEAMMDPDMTRPGPAGKASWAWRRASVSIPDMIIVTDNMYSVILEVAASEKLKRV